MLDLQVTEVEHYTDKLFRIRTERPAVIDLLRVNLL